jgi:hypothetical protein
MQQRRCYEGTSWAHNLYLLYTLGFGLDEAVLQSAFLDKELIRYKELELIKSFFTQHQHHIKVIPLIFFDNED